MMNDYENKAKLLGYHSIAGCDEVGRGPLAGPLVCAAVILDTDQPIEGLYDSKGLSEKRREALYEAIITTAKDYQIVFIDTSEVDRLNVYQASKRGMITAIKTLKHSVDYVLSDAMPLEGLDIPYQAIVKGDQKSASIAAASILAKVARDHYMVKVAKEYPGYGFEKHKGYPTKAHIQALNKLGPCDLHRKSFKPVQVLLEQQQTLQFD